jgi:hypothetical protein
MGGAHTGSRAREQEVRNKRPSSEGKALDWHKKTTITHTRTLFATNSEIGSQTKFAEIASRAISRVDA